MEDAPYVRENCDNFDRITREIYSLRTDQDVGALEKRLVSESKSRRGSARISERIFFNCIRRDGAAHILEVGANDGRHTRRFLAETQCEVHSFEPNVYAIEKLSSIVTEPRLRLNMYGLSDRVGVSRFNILKELFGKSYPPVNGCSSFEDRTNALAKTARITCAMSRGDMYLQENPEIERFALWVDVEGHAVNVLTGFGSNLEQALIVMCEVEVTNYFSSGANADTIIGLLENRGHVVVYRDFQNMGQFNVVSVHKSVTEEAKREMMAPAQAFVRSVASMPWSGGD